MEYSNPKIPEGINASKSHPLKEFMWLTGGVVAVLALLMLLLVLFADFLSSYIPYSVEQKISHSVFNPLTKKTPLTDYLQSLADHIALAENLPKEMSITVHYLDEDTMNAFATIGGHVFLYRGLLEKLTNENSLTMLLAHEIAHIKHRHPIKSLSRGILIGLAMSAISSSSNDAISEGFLNEAGFLTVMKFSRDMETESDQTAIAALITNYGHLLGANDLFTILQKNTHQLELPVFFSTHPLNEERIGIIKEYINNHSTQHNNKITALPENFKTWLK